MKQRIQKIFEHTDSTINKLLIKNGSQPDSNFFYLTGLTTGLHEGSIAIADRDGQLFIISSILEAETAQQAEDAEILTYTKKEELHKHLKNCLDEDDHVGVNAYSLSLHDYKQLIEHQKTTDFSDISEALHTARSIKEQKEIELIKKACQIADNTLKELPTLIKAPLKEYELAAEINYLLQKNGADQPAFETISSFGANSSQPHYTHKEETLKAGDIVLCDFGANYHKYNSDATRTYVYGHADAIQKEIYAIVLEAQQIAFDLLKPGVTGKEIDDAVRSHIDNTLYQGRFIHSTGHALGLDVHDPCPGLNSQSSQPLQEGMIVTVEPGIYLPDLGGVRIEDDILITANGCELLTKTPRELIEIPISIR